MKCAVVVSSKDGNTRMVSDALADALAQAGAEVLGCVDIAEDAGAAADAASAADVVLAGFWTDKGDCAPEMASFLEALDGKRVFLFGTAGFGGSAEYFARILGNVQQHLPASAELIGSAMCQGKMGVGVRKRYEGMLAQNPGDERIQAMIDNFDAALSHPDADDLAGIVSAAQSALGLA